jgi:hypothetical protein
MACSCVACADCGGSGNVLVPTNGYPEEDLELCEMCGGSSVVEECDECQQRELEHEGEW